MAAVSTPDLDRALALARNLFDAEPFKPFIGRVNPRFPAPRHLDPICRLIERTRYEQVFATISTPPRHRKTSTILNGLAWRMKYDPIAQHAFVSYNNDKARRESRRCRAIAKRAGVQLTEKRSDGG